MFYTCSGGFTTRICRRAIDVAFEGAEVEQNLNNLSIYICRLLEEHSVTIYRYIRLMIANVVLILMARGILKNISTFANKYTQKTHWPFKVPRHKCVRVKLRLWMVWRIVLHAERQRDVMHELSVERCPGCWRETSKRSVNYSANAVMLYTRGECMMITAVREPLYFNVI